MSLAHDIQDLVGYTAWQRAIWRTWFAQKGPAPLAVSTSDDDDGRFATIGDLIRHIFSSELRYAERIAGVKPTERLRSEPPIWARNVYVLEKFAP